MTRFFIGLIWLAHFLPLGAQAALGNAVGSLLFWLIPERRRVTRINLEKCFPRMPAAERERIGRAHFRVFCRSIIERGLLWWAPRERIERLMRVEGLEHLRALKRAGHFLRGEVGRALGLRVTPELRFAYDTVPDTAERVEEPTGRVARRKANYASAIGEASEWKHRLDRVATDDVPEEDPVPVGVRY